MCKSVFEGGLRCSAHAREKRDDAREYFDIHMTSDSLLWLRQAQVAYDATPAGIEELSVKIIELTENDGKRGDIEKLQARKDVAVEERQKQVEVSARNAAINFDKSKEGGELRRKSIEETASQLATANLPTVAYGEHNFIASEPIPDESLSFDERKKNTIADLRKMGFKTNIGVPFRTDAKLDGTKALWASRGNTWMNVEGQTTEEQKANHAIAVSAYIKNGIPVLLNHKKDDFRAVEEKRDLVEAESLNASKKRLDELAESSDYKVVSAVARNERTHGSTLDRMAKGDGYSRHSVACHPNASPETQKHLVKEFPEYVALNRSISPEMYSRLSKFKDEEVQDSLVSNPSVPIKTVASMLNTEHASVLKQISKRADYADVARYGIASSGGKLDEKAYATLKAAPDSYVVELAAATWSKD